MATPTWLPLWENSLPISICCMSVQFFFQGIQSGIHASVRQFRLRESNWPKWVSGAEKFSSMILTLFFFKKRTFLTLQIKHYSIIITLISLLFKQTDKQTKNKQTCAPFVVLCLSFLGSFNFFYHIARFKLKNIYDGGRRRCGKNGFGCKRANFQIHFIRHCTKWTLVGCCANVQELIFGFRTKEGSKALFSQTSFPSCKGGTCQPAWVCWHSWMGDSGHPITKEISSVWRNNFMAAGFHKLKSSLGWSVSSWVRTCTGTQ